LSQLRNQIPDCRGVFSSSQNTQDLGLREHVRALGTSQHIASWKSSDPAVAGPHSKLVGRFTEDFMQMPMLAFPITKIQPDRLFVE
jgi:hypothetical protein